MGVAERIRPPGLFDVDRYMAFLQDRPDEEKWQLVDGVAQRMTPPSLVHQRIAMQLATLLNRALRQARPELFAYVEAGMRLPGVTDFQPEPDVLVLASQAPDGHWATSVQLVAEILSRSNEVEHIARKVELYCAHPDNLHVLVVDQDTVRVTHRARAADWRPVELGEADRLILPEFGFDCAVSTLYDGTKLALRG